MNIKRILSLLGCFVLILFYGCQQKDVAVRDQVFERIQQTKTLRVMADFNTPPFSYLAEEKPVGFEVDLMEAIAKELGMRIEWQNESFDMAKYEKHLNEGKADVAIAAITKTTERERMVDFSLPYFMSGQDVLVNATEQVPDYYELNLLNGKKVGVEKGTTGEQFARSHTGGVITVFENSETMLNDLMNGTIAAVISDISYLQRLKIKKETRIKTVLRKLTREEYCLVVKNGASTLTEKLNHALWILKDDPIEGEYARVYRKWFYDGQ